MSSRTPPRRSSTRTRPTRPHPSHQAFLRAYTLDANGHPVATGELITNKNLGADGHFGGTDVNADTQIGGMATWAIVKAQARDILGINLTDADVFDVPCWWPTPTAT